MNKIFPLSPRAKRISPDIHTIEIMLCVIISMIYTYKDSSAAFKLKCIIMAIIIFLKAVDGSRYYDQSLEYRTKWLVTLITIFANYFNHYRHWLSMFNKWKMI